MIKVHLLSIRMSTEFNRTYYQSWIFFTNILSNFR